MTRALAEVQNNTFIEKSDITIRILGKEMIDNKFNANLINESTYGRTLETFQHIQKSNIAEIKIQEVTTSELQDFLNSKKDYANSYIDKFYEMLGRIFEEAIKRSLILNNPLKYVIKPKSSKKDKEVEALTIEEQKAFVKELENEQYKNILLIALHTGMRIGEILALKPSDIDFKNNVINTVLSAKVYKGKKDMTDVLDASKFTWRRTSTNKERDARWNDLEGIGVKEIIVTREDVNQRATFSCEISE